MEHHFKSRLYTNGSISHAGMERRKRGLGTSTKGELWLTMFPGLFQALNTTNVSQCDIIPRVTHHAPFYFSTTIPAQPYHPGVNTHDDAMVTRGMNTACGANAGQIDGHSFHIVEGANPHDKENDEQ